jgi:dihydropteroate synthase
VNDVSGGLADPRMHSVVAAAGIRYVAMHWRAHADHMRDFAVYDGPGGVVAAVRAELAARAEAMAAAGIERDRIVLDPGLGFAKRPEHNWQLLQDLPALQDLGYPLLLGASRKSFLGRLLASGGTQRPVAEREHANTALTVLLAQQGVWGLRVHDVRAAKDALRVLERLEERTQDD